MAVPKHLIKKYANRKLYDTLTSRYVTLQDISQLLRDGHDVQVLDRETGRDVTPLILSQIVASAEKRGHSESGGDAPHERGQALLEYVRRTLSGSAAMISSRVERGRLDLEELVDTAVERALKRLTVPTHKDLEALNSRVDALEARLDRLPRDGTPPPKKSRR